MVAGNPGESTIQALRYRRRKGEIVAGTEQPVFYWKDSPAVSGMAFYNSDKFPPVAAKNYLLAR
ncbi:PQQ-dependent sugar dehydrogenase [Escherichia coli]|nr:PQQ-dependent sugar dehydrogenase [Escherichia coli]